MPPLPPLPPPPPSSCLSDTFALTVASEEYLVGGVATTKLFGSKVYTFSAPVEHPVRFLSSDCGNSLPVSGGVAFFKGGFSYVVGHDLTLDLSNCALGQITLSSYFSGLGMGAINRLS
jgi:hypothetical protein